MTIVTQSRKAIVNFNNANSADIQGGYVRIYVSGESPLIVAHYDTNERAESEFARMIDALSCKQNVFYLAEA